MKVLVTGANGFVGQHLIEHLLNYDYELFAGVRNTNINVNLKAKKLIFNIDKPNEIREALNECKADAIIHLAAQSNVFSSWNDPASTFEINTIGTINLINMVSEILPNSKIITVGSSEEYGISAKTHEFLTESIECIPQNPYAVSKLSMGQIALQLGNKHGLNIIHTRPFNHFGPGQRKGFVISDFASQIVEIESGLQAPKIYVGNLNTLRDFTDVRDIVNAYRLLLENNVENGIYNISSGIQRSIKDILNNLIILSNKDIEVVIDSTKFRNADVKKFAGNSSKLVSKVGWSVKYEFYESLKETLDWWRSQVNL